ncbi:hypothetical protein CIPAW_15G071800 [Carya illinoinensis]|uniref:Uncharacterized protein n=1 Tax=Carya illinoinensis TaxID=32201 RepID=A0A8T1NCM9_CARIL|nr:hypothetical protein CIPAW_15G071800 [Carya illinoinensis]
MTNGLEAESLYLDFYAQVTKHNDAPQTKYNVT